MPRVLLLLVCLLLVGCGGAPPVASGTATPVAGAPTAPAAPVATTPPTDGASAPATASAPPPTQPTTAPGVPPVPPSSVPPSPVPPSPVPPTATPDTSDAIIWVTEQGVALDRARDLLVTFAADQQLTLTVRAVPSDQVRLNMLAEDLLNSSVPAIVWGSQEDLAELYTDGFLQPVSSPRDPDLLLPPLVASAEAEGALWGVPLMGYDLLLLARNPALAAQPVATSDDLLAVARSAPDEQAGVAGEWQRARWLLPWFGGAGGALTTPDGALPALASDAMVTALNLVGALAATTPDEAPPATWATFQAGQAVFAIDGPWAVLAEAADAQTVSTLPTVGATGAPATPLISGSYLMLTTAATREHETIMTKLADYLLTSDVQAQFARELQRVPADVDVAATFEDDATLQPLIATSRNAFVLPPDRPSRCAVQAIDAVLPVFLAPPAPADGAAASDDEPLTAERAARRMQDNALRCLGIDPTPLPPTPEP